jgi:adenine-specific DNA glycosylase
MNEYNGEFPNELEIMINRLPGVGRYTAGAVSSIAFNQVFLLHSSPIRMIVFFFL